MKQLKGCPYEFPTAAVEKREEYCAITAGRRELLDIFGKLTIAIFGITVSTLSLCAQGTKPSANFDGPELTGTGPLWSSCPIANFEQPYRPISTILASYHHCAPQAWSNWAQFPTLFAGPDSGVVMKDASSFAGGTADAKLNECIAAIAKSGGVCDARGFGATKQTIASPVIVGDSSSSNGYSSPAPQYVLFDPSTIFVPANSNTTLLQIGIGGHVDGFQGFTGEMTGYSVPAIKFSGGPKSWFFLGASLTNSSVFGTKATGGVTAPRSGSSCLAMKSDDSTLAISFATVVNFACVGEHDGIYLSASGNGYINTNYFTDVTLYAQIYAVEMETSGKSGASITGNSFSGLGIEWGNLGYPSTYLFYLHGGGNAAPIRENTFWGLSLWDVPPRAVAIQIAPDGTATRNVFQGLLNISETFNQIVDGNSSNLFWDLNFQILKGGTIAPSILIASHLGNGAGLQMVQVSSCASAPFNGATCTTDVDLPTDPGDEHGKLFCSMTGVSGSGYINGYHWESNTHAVVITISTSAAAYRGEMDCLFAHQ